MEVAAFYVFAALAIGSGLFILFSKSLMHAAFALFFTFIGVSALYILAGADFLGIAQLMIYIGGILVLIIFGIMLTRPVVASDPSVPNRIQVFHTNRFLGGTVALLLFLVMVPVILTSDFALSGEVNAMHSTLHGLGIELMTGHLLPFELAAVILLVALLGASYLALNRKSSL